MKKRTVAAALLFTMVMTTSLSTVSGAENVTILKSKLLRIMKLNQS